MPRNMFNYISNKPMLVQFWHSLIDYIYLDKMFVYKTRNVFDSVANIGHCECIFPIALMNNVCVYRHLQLRITAIRETFEELGLLICSRKRKEQKTGLWADTIEDIDVKHWQARVSLLSLSYIILQLCQYLVIHVSIRSKKSDVICIIHN